MVTRAYPADIVTRLASRWQERGPSMVRLPPARALEEILDTAYHASLLHEELRPLRFRLLVGAPASLPIQSPRDLELQVFEFDPSRRLTDGELRRLAPAADFERSLIGVHAEREGSPYIWGLASTGIEWLRRLQSGRLGEDPSLPDALVVHVVDPGHLLVARGASPLLELQGGSLHEHGHDVFRSDWLRELFAPVRAEVVTQAGADGDDGARPVTVGEDVVRGVSQHLLRRALAAIRRARHGGTLVIVPPIDPGDDLDLPGITLKYRFADRERRRRFRQLMLSIVATLMALARREGVTHVDWAFFRQRHEFELRALEEGVVELAQLMASLASVDGAVVMNRRFDLLGFGGEITASEPVTRIRRAMDLEADHTEVEVVDGVGTRHRSVYRLCHEHPDALAFVVSQDGTVTVVHAPGGHVTTWNQQTFGL